MSDDLNLAPPVAAAPVVETIAASPLEQYIQKEAPAAPVVEAAQPPAPYIPAAPAPAAPVAPAGPTEAEKVQQLGEATGLDLSRFKDFESAKSAAEMWVDQFAQMGLAAPPQEPESWQPPAPVAPVAAPVTEIPGLDEATVDPSVIAYLKNLQAKVQTLEAANVTTRQQHSQQAMIAVAQKADALVDSLASEKYGTSAKRNPLQTIAARNLATLAGAIVQGYRQAGQPIPAIEHVMQMAILRDSGQLPAKSGQVAVVPTKPFTLPPSSPATAGVSQAVKLPRISRQNDPYNDFADPTVRAIWAEALNR